MTTNTLRLAAGGKITPQLSWQLPITQYLPSLVDNTEDSGKVDKDAFMKSTGVLNVAAVVFGKRVDHLHDALHALAVQSKVADPSAFPSFWALKFNPIDDSRAVRGTYQICVADAEESPEAPKKSKRKKAAASSVEETLAPVEQITMPNRPNPFNMDPLHTFVSSAYDEGDISGLLMNQLSFFGGADLEFSSHDVLSNLVAEYRETPASKRLNLSWLSGALERMRSRKEDFVPSIVQHLPEHDPQVTSRILECLDAAAAGMKACVGTLAACVSPMLGCSTDKSTSSVCHVIPSRAAARSAGRHSTAAHRADSTAPTLPAHCSNASTEFHTAVDSPVASGATSVHDRRSEAQAGSVATPSGGAGFDDSAGGDGWVGFGDPDDPDLAPAADAFEDDAIALKQVRFWAVLRVACIGAVLDYSCH